MQKLFWIGLLFVALASIAIGLLYKRRGPIVATDIPNVEREIRDDLPKGTPRSQVEAYLDAKGIQHSYVDQSKEAPEYTRTEMAMIRGASRSWLVRGDIQILFKFDENGNLTSRSVRQINTGP